MRTKIKEFKQTHSIANRLVVTILIIAGFFLLEFVGLYYASQNTLNGLTEMHRSIRALTHVRQLRQLLATQHELLQKVKKGRFSHDDRIIMEASTNQIDDFLEMTMELVRDHPDAYGLISDAQKILSSLKRPSWRMMAGKSNYQRDIIIATQYTLELQDNLGKVQLVLAQNSDEIFNRVYKFRFRPLMVGLALSVFFLLFALWMGLIMKNRIDEPIQSLVEATKALSAGNLSARTSISETNELGVLSNAFNTMAARLEETTVSRNLLNIANQELEAFSYSISHDLRAPLRAIDGFSKALLEDAGDTLNAESKSHINRIILAVNRMSELIDAVLNLSRITRTEMQLAPIDLSAMAREVASELKKVEPQRNVQFKIQDNLLVTADHMLMRIVIENLLENSWKYTSKKEDAVIEFGMSEDSGKQIFYVRDNGVGFDMQYSKKLFTPFQRLHNQNEFPGTGVGLASVKRVIHRHGGRVWAQAQPNVGTSVFFTFQAD